MHEMLVFLHKDLGYVQVVQQCLKSFTVLVVCSSNKEHTINMYELKKDCADYINHSPRQ